MDFQNMGRGAANSVSKYRTRADCYLEDLKETKSETLSHLKKLTQLETSCIKTYKEETQDEIRRNTEMIENLRNSIREARQAMVHPNTKYDVLMRRAMKDYHDGSSIFWEKEPRDIHENADNKVRDLNNKLNKLRHLRATNTKRLHQLEGVFKEAVRDAVFLDLEGPAGDTRVLALENDIGETEKKSSEAEMLNALYRRIRQQLVIENMHSDNAINAVNLLIKHHQDELQKCHQACAEAIARQIQANNEAMQMDIDMHNGRRSRHQTEADFRKERDGKTHELNELWFKIQAHFASQDTMPMGHNISALSRANFDLGHECSVLDIKEQLEEQFTTLGSVMGCKLYTDVLDSFEMQFSKFQHLSSQIREMEQSKYEYLAKLEGLANVHASQTFRAATLHEEALEAASGDCLEAKHDWNSRRWSVLAAHSRVTQMLSHLRDVLQYLVDVLARAGLVGAAPRHDRSHTELHLLSMLAAATAGIQQLMQHVEDVDVEQVGQTAAHAGFVMTKSEMKMRPVRARIDRGEHRGPGQLVDSDDTTDDVKIPTRAAIKRQAQILLQAMSKRGTRHK